MKFLMIKESLARLRKRDQQLLTMVSVVLSLGAILVLYLLLWIIAFFGAGYLPRETLEHPQDYLPWMTRLVLVVSIWTARLIPLPLLVLGIAGAWFGSGRIGRRDLFVSLVVVLGILAILGSCLVIFALYWPLRPFAAPVL